MNATKHCLFVKTPHRQRLTFYYIYCIIVSIIEVFVMTCKKCGNQINDKSITCPICGEPISETADNSAYATNPPVQQNTPVIPKKKNNIRVILITIVVVLVVIYVIGSMKNNSQPTSGDQPSGSSSASSVASVSAAAATITKAEYDSTKSGMTYDEVKKIIGGDGKLMTEAGDPNDKYYTAVYSWYGEGSFAIATFSFQAGKLHTKSQTGLQ